MSVTLVPLDPTIIQSIRYASHENFIGKPVVGYEQGIALLTEEAALALHQAQQAFLKDGYSLVVYDAYRPQKSVDSFILWAKDRVFQEQKQFYYPRVDKRDVFDLGYLAEKSMHTLGNTVDVTLIPVHTDLKPIERSERILKDGFKVIYLDDGTVDMGTSFDLFDEASHHDSPLISKEHLKMRNYLKDKMAQFGFQGIDEEWWHYTLTERDTHAQNQ